ncbi:hypothetical protein IQ07DRAFT_589878 [Pyrenochaeta sp. DS3sAY3a]|nr:hypothetical protein IQ07DRAFT_589878 [Pyrenochaeta sp. DS3sAY3a]
MANLTILYALLGFFFINIASSSTSISFGVEPSATDVAGSATTTTTTTFIAPNSSILNSVVSTLSTIAGPSSITGSGLPLETSTLASAPPTFLISANATQSLTFNQTSIPTISVSATHSGALTTTVSSTLGNVTSIVVETSTAPPVELSTTVVSSNITTGGPLTTVLTVTANRSSTVTVTTASASASRSPLPADAAAGLDMVPAVLMGGLVLAVFGA